MEKPGRIVIIRHGERVDHVYGQTWIERCFNEKGEYVRFDLNMPKSIPKGKNKKNLELDPPLSQIGICQATLIGESFAEQNVNFQRVYCSPSLRCLQTCLELLQANDKNNLNSQRVAIEPGLFDPILLTKICPDWLSDEEIKSLGLNVKMNYQPIFSREKMLINNESIKNFHERLYHTMNEIFKQVKNQEGNTLIVTHAGSVSYVFRKLLHYRDPNFEELMSLLPYFDFYCIHIELEEKDLKPGENVNNEMEKWKVVESSIPNLKHLHRNESDWNAYEQKMKEIL